MKTNPAVTTREVPISSGVKGLMTEFLLDHGRRSLFLQGDALETLKLFPEACVDACLTSPPYWDQRKYDGSGSLGGEDDPEEYIARLVQVFRALRRTLKRRGSLWLNLGDTYKNKSLCGMPWRVALALKADGWILRNAVVWDKVKGNPCNAKDKLRNVHEYVFHLVQDANCYYDDEAIRNAPGRAYRRDGRIVTATGVSGAKYERQIRESPALSESERRAAFAALRETLRKVERGELFDFRMVIRGWQRATHSDSLEHSGRANELATKGFYILPYHPKGSKPGDVWRIVPEDEWRKDGHCAVFPIELCETPIKATCPPGGLLLDPFAGTGSAVVAAVLLGRRGIGLDTSERYLETARARATDAERKTANETAQGRLFGP